MGAQGSKPDQEVSPGDAQFFATRDNPVQFSENLISHLQNQSLPSSAVPSSRQEALDAHIQQRIASELARLREQEHQVRDEIERALEKENLDRERGAAAEKGLSHSSSLMKDLEDLEKRSAKLVKQRQETPEWRGVELNKEALVQCFKNNKTTPLDCREQAEKFKEAVAGVERAFFQTASAFAN
ncbi:hypothetical protein JCM8547_007323 [Rhodosporidiobolus lusitaniae]